MLAEKQKEILEKIVSKVPSKWIEESNKRIIMQRKNVIILIQPNKEPICRGNFKKLCDELELPYHSLKMLIFPINYKYYTIHKVEFM